MSEATATLSRRDINLLALSSGVAMSGLCFLPGFSAWRLGVSFRKTLETNHHAIAANRLASYKKDAS